MSKSKYKKNRGRYFDRSEYDGALERHNEQVHLGKNEYTRRQAILEDREWVPLIPFLRYRTIKRQWVYNYTLMKGIEKVDTEFSLICLVYNFKRVMTIMGKKNKKKALKSLDLVMLRLTATVERHITTFHFLNQVRLNDW